VSNRLRRREEGGVTTEPERRAFFATKETFAGTAGEGEDPGGFEFPPPRPDQALLGCRGGQVKNKSNDPAAYHQSEASQDDFGSQSQFGFNLLKYKEFLVPGEDR
jgi:hypothetical protein